MRSWSRQAFQMVGTGHASCPGKQQSQSIRTAVHDFESDQTIRLKQRVLTSSGTSSAAASRSRRSATGFRS
jgi:hypothetical protein